MKAALIALIAIAIIKPESHMELYHVWSEQDTLHLVMCDNGTPDNRDDDWVVDWEDNRNDVRVAFTDEEVAK